MTWIVGLTGGIGSGKSTVGARFADLGAGVIDADAVSHAVTRRDAAGWRAIEAEFGSRYFRPDGELDRVQLRQAVFADPAIKSRLEALLHPLIRQETARMIAGAAAPYVMLMVPLLFESGGHRERCRRVLVVDCSEDTQVRRVVARNAMTPDEVRAIMRTQIDRTRRLALADDVIDNEPAPGTLTGAVARLDHLYRRLAGA